MNGIAYKNCTSAKRHDRAHQPNKKLELYRSGPPLQAHASYHPLAA